MSNNNIKMTNQRIIILEYLKDNTKHPCVDLIYENVKKKLPRISKKTVYNNLDILVRNGYILELLIKGVKRYEPNIDFHQHLICQKCGNIIDIRLSGFNDFIRNKIKEIDFKIDFSNINFYGICNNCKKEVLENGK